MEFHLLHIFTLLSVALVASHGALPSEDYWKSVLPNTPMPKAVSDLLPSPVAGKGEKQITKTVDIYDTYVTAATEDELRHMSIGLITNTGKGEKQSTKGSVDVYKTYAASATKDELGHMSNGLIANTAGKREKQRTKGSVDVYKTYFAAATDDELRHMSNDLIANTAGKGEQQSTKGSVDVYNTYAAAATRDELRHMSNGLIANTAGKGEKQSTKGTMDVYKTYAAAATEDELRHMSNGLITNTAGKGEKQRKKGVDVYKTYAAATTEDEFRHMSNIAIFFLEKDLRQGTTMNLILTKTTNAANFLPRQVSKKIPFSSNKLPQILNQLSLKPNTMESKMLAATIKECEEPGLKGEEKYCATSLESMVDYSTSKLGKKVKAISTEIQTDAQVQKYKITGVKKMAANNFIVCHKRNYAYAVFNCHKTDNVRAYMVTMVDKDGGKAKTIVQCHLDTSAWNPKHLAFQLLKVKPGVVSVCHFLPEDTVVWVPY